MEYIELGPVPAGESCAQVGTGNYLASSMRECEVYRRMLARVFPIPDGLRVKYVVRSHPHDFGPYREVSIGFVDDLRAAVDFAYQVESALPMRGMPSPSTNSRGSRGATAASRLSATARCPAQTCSPRGNQDLLVAYPL